jgi:hypothetical protein
MVCGRMFAARVDRCDDPACEGHSTTGLVFEPSPPVPLEDRLAVLADWGLLFGEKKRSGPGPS